MSWLTSQSVWVLVIGSLVICLLVWLVTRLLTLRFMPSEDRPEAHAMAAALMTAFAAAFVLLTALTLSNEIASLSTAQNIVSTEAANAADLSWSATNPGVQKTVMLQAIHNYLVATRTYEWHGFDAANGDDPQTVHAIIAMENTVRAQAARPGVDSTSSTEMLTLMDALASQRRLRLAAAGHSIPDFYAVLVVVTGLALVINTAIVSTRGRWRAALVTTTLVVVIALSIALLFALATPWRGAIQVSGHPIDFVIHNLNDGYFLK